MIDDNGFTAIKPYVMVRKSVDSLKQAVGIGWDSRLFKGPAFFGSRRGQLFLKRDDDLYRHIMH